LNIPCAFVPTDHTKQNICQSCPGEDMLILQSNWCIFWIYLWVKNAEYSTGDIEYWTSKRTVTSWLSCLST